MLGLSTYAQSYKDYFWQWEEGDKLLTIPNGNTIAYREYIFDIMQLLYQQGIPPFGSLLLAIIGTNPQGDSDLSQIEKKIKTYYEKEIILNQHNSKLVSGAFSFLYKLNKLPQKYKEGKKRILVFQVIFESCHNRMSIKRGESILHSFKSRKLPEVNFNKDFFNSVVLQKDLRPLELLDEKFGTTDSIIEKIAALPKIGEPIEVQGKDFVQELIDNDKTFYIGALIRNIWSGLNIPLHSNIPSQQPLGGVSDISNKGDFDKLLITEFANESLVFLSRLANNEALYLNREIPPQADIQKRTVLIDISIRNWGTPKILAYAVLLALATHPKSKVDYTGYAVGNHYYPVSYDSVDTIIDALSNVDGCLNAYNGLSEYFAENNDSGNEVVFITTHDALKYPQMQLLLNNNRQNIDYIIYTGTDGKIEMFRQLKNSRKHLQTIHLPLEKLWKRNKPVAEDNKNVYFKDFKDQLLKSTNDNCPLLITPRFQFSMIKYAGEDVYCYCKGSLFMRIAKDKGWKKIYTGLPKGVIISQVGYDENGHLILFTCDNNKNLQIINILTGEKKNKIFKKHGMDRYTLSSFIDGDFYFYNRNIDGKLSTNVISGKTSLPTIFRVTKDLDVSFIKSETLKTKIEEYGKKIPYYQSLWPTITNVKSIAITSQNQLVINKRHLLRFHQGNEQQNNRITLDYFFSGNIDNPIKESAVYKDKIFCLRNGVTFACSEGILRIKFKDGQMGYVPLIKERTLAVALGDCVMGDSYFYENNSNTQYTDRIREKFTSDETWN